MNKPSYHINDDYSTSPFKKRKSTMNNLSMHNAAVIAAGLSYVTVKFNRENYDSNEYTYLLPNDISVEKGDVLLVPVRVSATDSLAKYPAEHVKAVVVQEIGDTADLSFDDMTYDLRFAISRLDLSAYEENQKALAALTKEITRKRNKSLKQSVLTQLGIDPGALKTLTFFDKSDSETK
jgi:hypothetical protein